MKDGRRSEDLELPGDGRGKDIPQSNFESWRKLLKGTVLLLWVLQKRDTHLVIDGVSRGTSGFPEQGFIFQRVILMLIAHNCLSTTKLPSVLRKHFFQRSLAWLSHFQH